MDENQGILLFRAFEGLPFQIAGALSRLGKRILTDKQEDSPKQRLLPIQQLPENWAASSEKFTQVIWAAPSSLQHNCALQDAEESELRTIIEKIKEIQNKQGQAPHFTLILPKQAFNKQIESLLSKLQSFNLLLSPAAWGFGDSALLDGSLALWKEKPGVLLKSLPEATAKQPRKWISFEELASQAVVCSSGRMTGKKNIIDMEGQFFSLLEWQNHFNQSFENEVGFMEKLASRLSSETLLDSLPESLLKDSGSDAPPAQTGVEQNHNSSSAPSSSLPVQKSSEVFPNPPISLSRSLSTILRAYKKAPEMQQCFLPGKSV